MSQASFPDLIRWTMRPPGGGIPTVSAGAGAELALQRRHYAGALAEDTASWDAARIRTAWQASWGRLGQARVVLLGAPLDTGAGIRRGAAYGPRGVRSALLEDSRYRELLNSGEVLDLGDILVNPHLLHDEMLSPEQIRACQDAMYPEAPEAIRQTLPVSALSVLKAVLLRLQKEHPHVRVFLIGGDHSVGWPMTEALHARHPGTLGIVQPDAHTDLLPARLGVKYCFGTWSYHANELLGRGGKLVQLGIRQSGRERSHWESTNEVRQFWASELRSRPEQETLSEIVKHLKDRGIRQVYFSNDIDGTDESHASATGTPASDGLSPEYLLQVIERLGREFELVGADVVEVAPDLGPTPEATRATNTLAARYALACLERMV